MGKQLLILEDDRMMVYMIQSVMKPIGYDLVHCTTVTQAKALLHQFRFEIALVDIGLGPTEENGLSFVRHVREFHHDIGVIVISGNSTVMDRVLGIEMGADDYLTKPFELRELTARTSQLSRRMRKHPQTKGDVLIRFSGFTLDRLRRSVIWEEGTPVDLTSREYDLLLCLLENENQVVHRNVLMNMICGREWSTLDRSVDVLVSNLRSKLRKFNPGEILIKSVRSQGYCFGGVIERVPRTREMTAVIINQ